MQGYDFHIHGKPYSQDVWKNDAYSDYLNGMYSNAYLNASADESYMIIEIHNKIVHYTYMRSKGIRDNVDREGSFFAITVSFKEQYCSVIALYNLLDQIYQIAKPSLFVPSKCVGCLKYRVLQLEEANVADQMLMAFDKNVMYLNLKDITNPIDTFRSNETKTVSLRDVDSPEFVDILLRNRVIVSSKLDSAVKRCGAIDAELAAIKAQKQTLLSSNERLQSEIAALSQENKSLSNQIHDTASSSEKKYKGKIEQLQSDLINITNERDSLRQKIKEATSSIELMDQPFQKLTRLLAGRFPENRSPRREDLLEGKQEVDGKNLKPIWRDWLNSILLGLVLVCCCAILVLVVKGKDGVNDTLVLRDNITEALNNPSTDANVSSSVTMEQPYDDIEKSASDESKVAYDDWRNCFPNIVGGGNNLNLNKKYSLFVAIQGTNNKATVPEGTWEVFIEPGQMLNNGDVFVLTDASTIGKNVMIQYVVNDKPVIRRVCKIVQ